MNRYTAQHSYRHSNPNSYDVTSSPAVPALPASSLLRGTAYM